MSYTNGLDNPELYFQTDLFTGNATDNTAYTLDGSENMQADWIWIKNRTDTEQHRLMDSVRGASKVLKSSGNGAEEDVSNHLKSFDSNGFTLGVDNAVNGNSDSMVAWCWKAGGTAPAITYVVKVVSDSGNKYRFDDFGTSAVTLDLQEGGTYTFDQSDSSNSGHPLRFSTTSDGSHGGGSEFTTNVTTTGTPGNAGAKTVITLGSGVATLYYYCTQHSAMGGQANTNSSFGSSNFSGSIQSTVSASNDAGFSIATWTGTGSNGSVGHGLGGVDFMIIKDRDNNRNWYTWNKTFAYNDRIKLDTTDAKETGTDNMTALPDSTKINMATSTQNNGSSINYVGYFLQEKKGYSKIGSYTGNGNSDGPFCFTGFRPSFILGRRTDSAGGWWLSDNKRSNGFNLNDEYVVADSSNAEADDGSFASDFLSNGWKARATNGNFNASGGSYIYMAFAESPFVNSAGAVPTNAR